MKLDRFAEFMLPPETRAFVDQYRSPESEASVCKDVPMDQLDRARSVMQVISGLTGQRMRVIYRGPRYDLTRCWVRREHARRFAIYFR